MDIRRLSQPLLMEVIGETIGDITSTQSDYLMGAQPFKKLPNNTWKNID
jgi:hypothetical protein